MTILIHKLVKQGFDKYNKITLIDNINILPTSYREDLDIVILRVTDKNRSFSRISFKEEM